MADVMMLNGNNNNNSLTSQKKTVKTLSIIDTISELALDKNEASRLSLPSPISVRINKKVPLPPVSSKGAENGPKVPQLGAKPRFLASSPIKSSNQSYPKLLNLSAINYQYNGSTPDWIRDIFHHAKRGLRDKLERATEGLESTLIRNLTDSEGNNLLHVVCSSGHTPLLPFLTSRFGRELSGALSDENRKGFTPVQLSIKLGRLECVQWLVRHSNLLEKLSSRDGERSLLHMAAKYGKEELVSWLSEEMSHQGLTNVDQLDIGANSPLHLAAKHGHISTVATLLNLGAQVALKNDMGLKPHDCAKIMGYSQCAEFLILYETSLQMAMELRDAQMKRDSLLSEHNELKSHFKDALSVGKRLARERDEMGRELRKIHDATEKLILDNRLDDLGLSEKWMHFSRQWFGASLAETDHRLWLAEESLRARPKTSVSSGPSSLQSQDFPQRYLRDRMMDLKSKALPSTSGMAANLASSSEEDISGTTDEVSNDYEDLDHEKGRIAQRKKLATPSPSLHNESLYNDVYYAKISPGSSGNVHVQQGKKSSLAMSESGTASVIEVIEPTASEEEEFKKALQEMNWSRRLMNQGCSPTLSKTSRGSSRRSSKYSSNGELSPTKRLLEMGIHTETIDNDDDKTDHKNNFFQKVPLKSKVVKKRRSPALYANYDLNTGDHEGVEEHVLPDSFDEQQQDDEDVIPSSMAKPPSVSPSSRQSSSSKGSEDSGIGVVKHLQQNNNLSKIEERPGNKSIENKAWYDVPSDDDAEAPEADSLASIISHNLSDDGDN